MGWPDDVQIERDRGAVVITVPPGERDWTTMLRLAGSTVASLACLLAVAAPMFLDERWSVWEIIFGLASVLSAGVWFALSLYMLVLAIVNPGWRLTIDAEGVTVVLGSRVLRARGRMPLEQVTRVEWLTDLAMLVAQVEDEEELPDPAAPDGWALIETAAHQHVVRVMGRSGDFLGVWSGEPTEAKAKAIAGQVAGWINEQRRKHASKLPEIEAGPAAPVPEADLLLEPRTFRWSEPPPPLTCAIEGETVTLTQPRNGWTIWLAIQAGAGLFMSIGMGLLAGILIGTNAEQFWAMLFCVVLGAVALMVLYESLKGAYAYPIVDVAPFGVVRTTVLGPWRRTRTWLRERIGAIELKSPEDNESGRWEVVLKRRRARWWLPRSAPPVLFRFKTRPPAHWVTAALRATLGDLPEDAGQAAAGERV